MASQGRKRVDAVDSGSSSVFVRAKDGSAFARRQDCNKDVPVALISMHNCSLEAKIKMNLGLFCFKKPSTTNPLFTFLASSSRALPRSPSWSCFLDAKEGRYNPKMSPKIPRERWRKGSQLITLVRKQAEVIVDDDVIFSAFKKYCKRRPPIDTRKGKLNLKLQKQHNCIPDEHYVQTLLALLAYEGINAEYLAWDLKSFEFKTTFEDVFPVEATTVAEYPHQAALGGGVGNLQRICAFSRFFSIEE